MLAGCPTGSCFPPDTCTGHTRPATLRGGGGFFLISEQLAGPSAAAGHDVVLYDARSGELLGGMGPERPPEAGRTRVVTSLAPARDGAFWLGQGSRWGHRAVDPDRGQVLAHRMLDAYVHAVLLDGRLVVMDEAESGYQWAEVLRLELVGLPAR